MSKRARLLFLIVAAALALAMTGCGGSSTTTDTSQAPAGTSAESPDTKVSANTASEDDIAKALESAGVSNPKRWAEEVVEYRPYPANDPNLTKLRDNLAKYNPGQENVEKIVSALTP